MDTIGFKLLKAYSLLTQIIIPKTGSTGFIELLCRFITALLILESYFMYIIVVVKKNLYYNYSKNIFMFNYFTKNVHAFKQ